MVNIFTNRLIQDCFGCSNYGVKYRNAKQLYKKLGLNLSKLRGKYIRKSRVRLAFKDGTDFLYGKTLMKALKDERSFLGMTNNIKNRRYRRGLPSNGQHTQTNARSVKRHRIFYVKKIVYKVKKGNSSQNYKKKDFYRNSGKKDRKKVFSRKKYLKSFTKKRYKSKKKGKKGRRKF